MPKIYKILGFNRYWEAFSSAIISASGKYDAGLKAGEKQKAIEMARKLKLKGIMSDEEIAEITGLTKDEILTLT
jgi:hypothetical protein